MDDSQDLERRVLIAIKRGLAGEWNRGQWGKMGVSALEIAGRLDENPQSVAQTCLDLAEEDVLEITYNELAGYISVRILDVTAKGEARLDDLRQSASWLPVGQIQAHIGSPTAYRTAAVLGWALAAILAWLYWTEPL